MATVEEWISFNTVVPCANVNNQIHVRVKCLVYLKYTKMFFTNTPTRSKLFKQAISFCLRLG